MALRLLTMGQRVSYYENIEGGHAGAADNEQRAGVQALELGFLWQHLA
jgi:prolyl oligopeptidase